MSTGNKNYPELGEKPVSELDREDFTEILKNLYRNKKEVFQIFWDIYPDYPLVQFGVLFVLLFAAMDFFPALLTLSLYLIFTVCITIGINVWNDNSHVHTQCWTNQTLLKPQFC